MVIKEARFIMSNQEVNKCPAPNKPEYAFIGRSNVGKSSLINMLCQSKKLAKISSTPGKTQYINHFLINNSWYLVDLPGYGYAKLSKTKRADLGKIISGYLTLRDNLMCLFVLIDVRLEPQPIDLSFIREMGEAGISFCIVFTKTDKLTPTLLKRNIANYRLKLMEEWEDLPEIFIASSEKKEGRAEILDFIGNINKQWHQ